MRVHQGRFFSAVAAAAIVLCALCGSVSSLAQSSATSKDVTLADFLSARKAAFDRLDKNTDGVLTPEEWPGRKRAFRVLDINRDNSLTLEEFRSTKARWWNQVFENIDLDGNRAITRDEWMDVENAFDRLDRDRNGLLERREFYTAL